MLQNVKRVSPWQVEYVVPTPSLHSEFPPTKKCRVPQDPGLLLDGGGEPLFPMTGLNNSMVRHLNPSLMNFNSFPASIQGARQDRICVSSLSSFIRENTHQRCSDYFNGNVSPIVETVSTELNIGSSQLDNLSPDSQSSVHFFGNELLRKRVRNASPKVGITSFRLFGKIIHLKKPVENGFDEVGCPEDDGSKVYKEREGADNPFDRSSTYPYMKLLDRIDVQCQRASAGEACFF